jgi:polysaccharide export outer membrane protein
MIAFDAVIQRLLVWLASGIAITVASGCRSMLNAPVPYPPITVPVQPNAPRELTKTILPPYRIEPPDILQIDAIRVVPKFPYHLRMLDSLVLQVSNALPDAPISGSYVIEPGGTINLGNPYGSVSVAGKTVEEAKQAIEAQLKQSLREPIVNVNLGEIASRQQIGGQHLVTQDGTVTLGSYGSVEVVGQTIGEAKESIERYLATSLQDPEVSVEVYAYNSKNYYVITQGGGLGDGVTRFPITGNDTVLDAVSQISGFTSVSSTKIWVARPGRTCDGHDQILPVDWCAISQRGDVTTNYQLLPGDRLYIAADKLVSLDTFLGKVIAPIERILGVALLGGSTVFEFKNGGSSSGGGI